MNVGIILGKNRNNSLVVAEYELYEFEKEKKDTTSELDSSRTNKWKYQYRYVQNQ